MDCKIYYNFGEIFLNYKTTSVESIFDNNITNNVHDIINTKQNWSNTVRVYIKNVYYNKRPKRNESDKQII